MVYFFQSLSLKVRFLVLVLLLFPVLGLQWLLTAAPWGLARLKMLGHGVGLPDMGFWYDPAALQAVFAAWGEAGRNHYLTVLWPTDLGFLLSYALLLTTAVLYLLKKTNPAGPWWYLLPLLPLAAATADLLENTAVAAASLLLSSGWEPVAWLAGTFTASKWVLMGATSLVLVAGTAGSLVAGSWKKVRAVARDEGEETPPL